MEEKIQIFIPDGSYDNETVSAKDFESKLCQQLKSIEDKEVKISPLTEANIGSGADWPSFMAEIIPLGPYAGGLALFFLGKTINENLDAWVAIGGKIARIIQLVGGRLNRGAALLVALFKAKEQVAKMRTVKILQYETLDRRFIENIEKIIVEKKDFISDEIAEEYRGDRINYFRLKVDDVELEFIIKESD